MPNLAEHPVEAVKIRIGGQDYKFRITLGTIEDNQRDEEENAEVPSTREEAKAKIAEAKKQNSLSGLLDTLWLARQPYRQEGETRKALVNAIGPDDTANVMRGWMKLMNRQIDKKKIEEVLERATGEASNGKKKTPSES